MAIIRNIDSKLSVSEVIVAAGLDWEARKIPLEYVNPGWKFGDKGARMLKSGEHVVVRSDNGGILARSVGKNWTPPKNSEVIEFFRDLMARAGIEWKGVGMMGGTVVFAQAQLGQEYQLANEKALPMLLMSASYKYGLSTACSYSDIIVICWNTLMAAMSDKRGLHMSFTHRREIDLAEVKAYMQVSEFAIQKRQKQAAALLAAKAEESDLKMFFDLVFPLTGDNVRGKELSRNALKAMELNDDPNQPGQELRGDSWWRALNTVTYMTDNVLGRTEDGRQYNAHFGASRTLKVKATNEALRLAGVIDSDLFDTDLQLVA